jgi:membrane protease YdiL (CAAX protease family)
MKTRLHPNLAALVEVLIMFLPGIPAYLWLWPKVDGTAWLMPVQIAVYLYFLAGCLIIGLRRWNLSQLGLNRKGLGVSLVCGLVLLAGRTLVILAIDWPIGSTPLTLRGLAGDIVFLFALVGLIEELLFRGVIYHALDEWRGARLAIWGSALAFGLYHVRQGPLVALGGFIIGLIFGVIRWRAGGIVGLILVHGLIDVTAKEMLPTVSIQELGRPQVVHPILVVLGYGLIVAVPLYLWRLHPSIERMRAREPGDSLANRR